MINEEKLLSKLKQKDQHSFKIFYYQYYKIVYFETYMILNNKEDAEDASQNTFVKFMKNIDKITLDSSLKTIITHLAKNEAIDLYRKNSRKREVVDETLLQNITYSNHDNRITIDLIKSILDDQSARIVILKILYSYSFQEIAEDIHLTIGKVQNLYYKAIDTLKEKYKEVN